jgi:hypothetical protein
MKFYYNLMDGYDEPDRFYTEQTIRRFRVYPATPKIEKAALEPGSGLWPVHDIFAPISELNQCVECKDLNEAYDYILQAQNHSVFEYIHDI